MDFMDRMDIRYAIDRGFFLKMTFVERISLGS
jgi:hypothetical protein